MEKKLAVKLPQTPNFICVGDKYIHIRNFTDDELKQIGKEWTEALITKSKTGK